MTGARPDERVAERAGAVAAVTTLEGFGMTAGVIACGLIACAVLTAALSWTYFAFHSKAALTEKTGTIVLAMFLAVAEVASFTFVVRAQRRLRSPMLVSLARAQPRWPMLIRPLVMAWWAAHFTAVALAGRAVLDSIWFPDASEYERVGIWIIKLLILTAVSFSSNSYLLLSAGALSRDTPVLWLLYRARLLADVGMAVLMMSSPRIRWY